MGGVCGRAFRGVAVKRYCQNASGELAEPLFLARYIEKAGTGTLDMITLCEQSGLPEPEFRQSGGQFVQMLRRVEAGTPEATEQVTKLLLAVAGQTLAGAEIQRRLRLAHRPAFLYTYLQPALERGLIEMTIPDKPGAACKNTGSPGKGLLGWRGEGIARKARDALGVAGPDEPKCWREGFEQRSGGTGVQISGLRFL